MTPRWGRRPPKPLPYNFLLEVDGVVCARFQQVSGLDAPLGTPRKTIVLRRGIVAGPGLWAWRKQGNMPLKNGALAMLDASGREKGRWKFQGARIAKWVGPDLDAKGGSEVVLKALEIACEELDLE